MKAHGLLLYLPPSLYLALIRLQADKGLGRSFAGLLALTEGLYRLGYLEEKEYTRLRKRYSIPLKEVIVTYNAEEQLPPFKEALEEWDKRDKEWKLKWVRIAMKYPKVEEAQIIIEKAKEEGILVSGAIEACEA
ncbi:hypothetical protein DRO64_03315 [Candidatus Bathyarchaeota archaeon]|nr:MAG: hypothetical protein DRO64_03315 [Candidatus Bathyarchaeota archaeon]